VTKKKAQKKSCGPDGCSRILDLREHAGFRSGGVEFAFAFADGNAVAGKGRRPADANGNSGAGKLFLS